MIKLKSKNECSYNRNGICKISNRCMLSRKNHNENLTSDINVEVVGNPEFIFQGTDIRDTLYAPTIIRGSCFPKDTKAFHF